MNSHLELLLSLPPQMSAEFKELWPELASRSFATHDPENAQLGSGGGTAHVLHQAWMQSGRSFEQWMNDGQKIVIHGGGESRRLPAYAGVGKLFLPFPVLRWSRGQRLGQTLLDLNEPFLTEAFAKASDSSRVLIASGDVLLRGIESVSSLPDADVVLLGMWAAPSVAQNYGVMFCNRDTPQQLETFLQKPSPNEIRDRSRDLPFLIDVGVWLLSERAVECLMRKCGWDSSRQSFADGGLPENYDLYGEWAQHLGENPLAYDEEVSSLSVAIAPVEDGQFFHFGTTSDVVESSYSLQNIVTNQSRLGAVASLAQPKQFILDSTFGAPLRRQENESLWVEGSHIPATWKIGKRHMLTGVPENDWNLQLGDGVCLDFVPVGEEQFAIRFYGYDDRFRGAIDDPSTQWLENPAREWFACRGIDRQAAGIDGDTDLQVASLFPVLDREKITGEFMRWLVSGCDVGQSDDAAEHRSAWLAAKRYSARQLSQRTNLAQWQELRLKLREKALPIMVGHGRRSIYSKLDLKDLAKGFAASTAELPEPCLEMNDVMLSVHDRMFRSEVLRLREDSQWKQEEQHAFKLLEDAIVAPFIRDSVHPQTQLANDQIVWARSPVRVDFAGGWTDTAPYCIESGGSVVNLALNLNGQPPIQAFARRSHSSTITIRSIDLGISEEISSYEQLQSYRKLGNGFSVAKAALCLCGFHPDFNGGRYATLKDQLAEFGGGVDISMLAAVPKGSGLGTSSILSATVLGAISEMCEYRWDAQSIATRVSALEQMLGSGGGWQDQFGGLLSGAKLIQTHPGLSQVESVRWLPTDFFCSKEYQSRALLYYTGITRVAHDVLGEIVRGMFLNDPQRLKVLDAIRANSETCFEAVQFLDLDAFASSIRQSWQSNCMLDSGTNTPEVVSIVERIEPYVSAYKLCGAGGGGFMYLLAKDAVSAERIQDELKTKPPNNRARFVEMSVSNTGMQVSRS
ncbi:fucose kinase [Rhodopirellula sallentina SM41]|uniref:Fucose kinase n=2 Tax=Rhodopirellula TaxID=265488 RepID=M5U1D5_9BACT|nr:fucose kinase [Rhodopirellula sallentina SM41]